MICGNATFGWSLNISFDVAIASSFAPASNWASAIAPKSVGGHVRIYSKTEMTAKLRSAGLELQGTHRAHALHSPYWWLKCAVGPTDDDHPAVVKYREFLEWDIVEQPAATKVADRVLSPIMGKSIVFYATKPAVVGAGS